MIVKLKNVRVAFPQLFEPKAVNAGDKPAYSVSLLIPKGDPQIAMLQEKIEEAATEKWGKKATEILRGIKAKDGTFLHDGALKAQYDGYDECMYISARNQARPKVFDRARNEITVDNGQVYGGCYVNASIDVWCMDNQYGKKVCASIRGVQFVQDGDAFSGSTPASADEFDDLGDMGNDDLLA